MTKPYNTEIKNSKVWMTALGVIGCALLFAIILVIAYLPHRPAPLDYALVQQRLTTLAEVEAKQQELVSSYAWVDKEAGITRIPVDRAMELVILENKQ